MAKKKGSTEKETKVTGRTLLIESTDGEYRIVIPVGARLTFGPTIPYERKAGGYSSEPRGYSLRVYETAKNDSLVAVFGNVKGFRDITIAKAKLIVRESGKTLWKSDEEGYKVETDVKTERSFEEMNLLMSEGK